MQTIAFIKINTMSQKSSLDNPDCNYNIRKEDVCFASLKL
jgi:hypothetical protein